MGFKITKININFTAIFGFVLCICFILFGDNIVKYIGLSGLIYMSNK